jgi:precorrin-2 dehydrogenase/sirohydrochlorin ferrochelatase
MPTYYPVFLDLHEKRCVIIGGGTLAESKIAKLLESGAKITVVSPKINDGLKTALKQGSFEWLEREYQTGDLAGAFLGIAATNVRPVNDRIFQDAEELGILLNVVDEPHQCSFIAPSIVNRGPVTVAISTGGASPALARKLRETLNDSPDLAWADMASILSRARKQVKKQGATIDPQRWQCCITPDLLAMTQEGREEEALSALLAKLLGDSGPNLCDTLAQCQPTGCGRKPSECAA